MTVGAWIATRTPPPPAALRGRIAEALGDAAALDAAGAAEACLYSAEQLVVKLLRGQCTSRESALDLLTADALVTYAFEAAADAPADLAARASAAVRQFATLGAARREGAIA